MKFIKKISVLTDGSVHFYYELTTNNTELIILNLDDEKNFFLNKKKRQRQFDSKYSSEYKKKYFK